MYLTFVIATHFLGCLAALHAILNRRTAEGAVAWCLGLIAIPYLSLPLYFIFGPQKFETYAAKLAAAQASFFEIIDLKRKEIHQNHAPLPLESKASQEMLENFAGWPVTSGNEVQLLVDGEAAFDALFSSIRNAQQYVLIQFYILRHDRLGERLKDILIDRAKNGIRVYVMYDRIGSFFISRNYLRELARAGVLVQEFRTRSAQGLLRGLRINFRNHRKLVVVDGEEAFIGGFNVGNEYLGEDPWFGRWRDTLLAVKGPATHAAQVSFARDWYWASETLPPLQWKIFPNKTGHAALPIASGPITDIEVATMLLLDCINCANERIWISSPYFVPSPEILSALQLAALRGADVRILLPDKADQLITHLAGMTYIRPLLSHGVRVFRFQDGFLHQKAVLMDCRRGIIGSGNLDIRSLRLNFELNVVLFDESICKQIEAMFVRDFQDSFEVMQDELGRANIALQLFAHTCRLLSPVL